jgi:hypothetical protein
MTLPIVVFPSLIENRGTRHPLSISGAILGSRKTEKTASENPLKKPRRGGPAGLGNVEI